ncbi:MAG: EI24 domain-containing protein [bacterium]
MNDESKLKEASKEQENSSSRQTESLFDRKRPRLSVAKEKNPRPEKPEPDQALKENSDLLKENEEEEKKDRIKEQILNKAGEVKSALEKTFKEGTTLKVALKTIFSNGKLLVASLAVVLIMILVTIFSYHYISSWISSLVAPFFDESPLVEEFFDYFYYVGWLAVSVIFKGVTVVVVFYLSFIFAYILVSPLFSFISLIAEDLLFGKPDDNAEFSLEIIAEDIIQSLKVAIVAFLCTFFAFFVNFVPIVGQITAIMLYVVVNSLLLIDFPASRRRWRLSTKMGWLKQSPFVTLRIGSVPTLISMIPFVNSIVLAFLYPLFVVHSTMNFLQIEGSDSLKK